MGQEIKLIVCRPKLLCSDYPHEKFIASRWGDFYYDGTSLTIKQNYENAPPLPVHRCFAGLGVVDAVSPSGLDLLFLFCQPLEKPAEALECRSPESKEWEAFIVWRAAFSVVIQSERAIFNHSSAGWFHPSQRCDRRQPVCRANKGPSEGLQGHTAL